MVYSDAGNLLVERLLHRCDRYRYRQIALVYLGYGVISHVDPVVAAEFDRAFAPTTKPAERVYRTAGE